MVNYSEAKIYKVLNSVDNEVYVGSTTQTLAQRTGKHKLNATQRNTEFYQRINDVGLDNFYIELICSYPCDNIEELHSKEGEWIRNMGTLNQLISGRTPRQCREDNKDKLREQKQQCGEQNKDRIRENNNTENRIKTKYNNIMTRINTEY